ncbi:MAG: DUF2059 domain-containing protein [Planctomycetes bacterium]|nr:DUF2059 domain-containing protein [Planctomycetota bacterium]
MKSKLLLCMFSIVTITNFGIWSRSAGVQNPPAPAQSEPAVDDKEKIAEIHKLMEVTGSAGMAKQMMQQLVSSFKTSSPGLADDFFDQFIAEIDTNELTDLVVPIYAKYLSRDEVRELVRFYESAAGRKLITVMPQLMQDSIAAGQKWGMGVAQKLKARIDNREKSEKEKKGKDGNK